MPLKIPLKCIESWDNMSPTSQGKFCLKCKIEIVDFTNWQTQEIINYIQNSNTKVCGKISSSQSSSTSNKPTLWDKLYLPIIHLGLILSGLLLTKSVNAENCIKNTVNDHFKEQKDLKDSINIQGVVTDESNKPLEGSRIYNILTKELISTDSKGHFIFKFSNKQNLKYLRLSIKHIGYDILEINHDLSKNRKLKLRLKETRHEIGEVIVTYPRAKPNTQVDMSKYLQ